ncbi:helix-turn-helix transcriptional regulator [Clostridium sp. DL1XJH146]
MTFEEKVKLIPWYKKLQILRIVDDLTQLEAADKCNTTRKIFWLWEKGKSYPNRNSRRSIAKAFRIDEKELFNSVAK